MAGVTDGVVRIEPAAATAHPDQRLGSVAAALVLGGGLTLAAHFGDVELLVAVAIVQALLAAAWFGTLAGPGRRGGAAVALAAAGGADFVVMHWPDSRLGTLVPVFALALPAMFVHQLMRGVARVRLVESLSMVALLVLAVVALPALIQLRHEFAPGDLAAAVAVAAAGAATAALVAGHLVDILLPTPRFDADVPRGLPGLLAGAVAGAGIGRVVLDDGSYSAFSGARSLFFGGACGVLAALLSVAASFAVSGVGLREGIWAARLTPVFAVGSTLCGLAPGAFLVCLAVRA